MELMWVNPVTRNEEAFNYPDRLLTEDGIVVALNGLGILGENYSHQDQPPPLLGSEDAELLKDLGTLQMKVMDRIVSSAVEQYQAGNAEDVRRAALLTLFQMRPPWAVAERRVSKSLIKRPKIQKDMSSMVRSCFQLALKQTLAAGTFSESALYDQLAGLAFPKSPMELPELPKLPDEFWHQIVALDRGKTNQRDELIHRYFGEGCRKLREQFTLSDDNWAQLLAASHLEWGRLLSSAASSFAAVLSRRHALSPLYWQMYRFLCCGWDKPESARSAHQWLPPITTFPALSAIRDLYPMAVAAMRKRYAEKCVLKGKISGDLARVLREPLNKNRYYQFVAVLQGVLSWYGAGYIAAAREDDDRTQRCSRRSQSDVELCNGQWVASSPDRSSVFRESVLALGPTDEARIQQLDHYANARRPIPGGVQTRAVLSPKQHKVLALLAQKSLSTEDAAKALGKAPRTVRELASNGLRQIREYEEAKNEPS